MNDTGLKETPTEPPTCAFGGCGAPAVALLVQTFEGHPEPERRPICGPHSQLMELLIEVLERRAQLTTRAAPDHQKRSTCA